MVKYRPHIFFVGIMCSYFFVRFLRLSVEQLPEFIRFYLTDLLFVPAMCAFALIIVRLLKGDATLKISAFLVFTQVALVSLFFEWYLPYHSEKQDWYTSDMLDVVMYCIGGILFLILQRKF